MKCSYRERETGFYFNSMFQRNITIGLCDASLLAEVDRARQCQTLVIASSKYIKQESCGNPGKSVTATKVNHVTRRGGGFILHSF